MQKQFSSQLIHRTLNDANRRVLDQEIRDTLVRVKTFSHCISQYAFLTNLWFKHFYNLE